MWIRPCCLENKTNESNETVNDQGNDMNTDKENKATDSWWEG
jgi:hypothetical protein